MVQIDMKMPNNCMVCPLLSYIPHKNGDDEPVCCYTGDDLPEGYFCHDGGRPEFCPLKEAKKMKEREAVEPEVEVLNEIDKLYRCPKCHKHFFYEKQKYCDQCGQAVKWE